MSRYDYVICNARVVDGTGTPCFFADVGIYQGKIAAVGKLNSRDAEHVIDADGRFLTPGFVDAHTHVDLRLLAEPDLPAAICQGVTSHVIGQDGISYAPASEATQAHIRHYFAGVNGDPHLNASWQSVAEYLACFDRKTACNVAYLLPQGTIRYEVMGNESRRPTDAEMRRMQELVDQGMREGAVGISTGLDYLPCHYSDTDELVEICRPVARYGGVYVTHMRSYSARIREAVEETAEIGFRAGLAVHISHYVGKSATLIPLVDEARAKGSDMTYDAYPYLAGCSILSMVALPRWMEAGTMQERLQRLSDPETRAKLDEWFEKPFSPMETLQLAYIENEADRELEGLRVTQAAERRGQSVRDFVCDLLIRSDLRVACIVRHISRTEEDMIALMQHPAHMGGSDAIYTGGRPHPRGYGSFAAYLEYVRDRQIMPLEEMVQHLSSHPARRFHFHGRGIIAPGWFADLNLFALENIRAHATFENGNQLATGMDWVWVNGEPVLAEGKGTGRHPGVAIRGKGCLQR